VRRVQKKVITISVILVFLSLTSGFPFAQNNIQSALAQGVTRYHAGYLHYNSLTTSYSHPGVYAEIYTIDPSVVLSELFAEWVTTILSYQNGYWIQVGYIKCYSMTGTTELRYYVEYMDSTTPNPQIYPLPNGPSAGTWHSYSTRRPYDLPWEDPPRDNPNEWRFYIDESRVYTLYPDPPIPVDEQACAETSNTVINIDGTHFNELRVFDPQNYWLRWITHVKKQDPPYIVTEISHYEFYANGGG